MLSAYYRSPINFSEESLNQSLGAVERLNCWSDLSTHGKQKTTSDGSGTSLNHSSKNSRTVL